MRIAIIGGGFAGAATALELVALGQTQRGLAGPGAEIHIFERSAKVLDRASRHNEGKIHLGYIYGQDRSLRTADLMAHGAVVFQDALHRWLGAEAARLPVSPGFLYAVHRDSLISPEDFEAHLHACNALLRKHDPGCGNRFGGTIAAPRTLSATEREQVFDSDTVVAAYRTGEVSIDPAALCDALERRIQASAQITLHKGCEIVGIARTGGRLALTTATGEQAEFHHVVNAAWEGRLPLDRQMGLREPQGWAHRMKYYLRVEGQVELPTVSFVLGPFGDIVRYEDAAYLSWYPAGMRHWSFAPAPPAWPATLRGADAQALAHAIQQGLAGVVPSVAGLADIPARARIEGGVICAVGRRDVDDPDSALHDRTEGVGVQSIGNYHSFSSGKFSLIPYFAGGLAARILQVARRYG